jgi:3-deoxy-D-manno-octulosonic-acid transferase
MTAFAWKWVTLFTSFVTLAALSILKMMAFFGFKKARNWILPRRSIHKNLKAFKKLHQINRPVVLAFASSAGEYEQILPVLHRLLADGWAPVIAFFSPSGMKYASVRAEEIPWIPSPLDTTWHVRAFFDALKPKLVLVSKQELWPCFLWEASNRSKLVLIDAAAPAANSTLSPVKNWINCAFYQLFHSIYCVSKSDYAWLTSMLGKSQNIFQAGDTKYDRAFERLMISKNQREISLQKWHHRFGKRDVLLIGSAWPEDVKFVLKALKNITKDLSLVIVPHDPTPTICSQIASMLSEYNYKFSFYSKLEQTDSTAVIVDQLGVLFDLYDIASWVWVGGAVHHQVHNVLEPTMRGIPTAFGEKYLNSQEARELVTEDLVLASSDPIQFANWLAKKLPKVDHPLENYFRQKLGASDYIHKSLQSFQFNLQE